MTVSGFNAVYQVSTKICCCSTVESAKSMSTMDAKIEEVQRQLAELRRVQCEERKNRRKELQGWKLKQRELRASLQSVRVNNTAYLSAMEDEYLPRYVVRNQAKLCKMIHRMHVDHKILIKIKDQCQDRIRYEHRTMDLLEQEAPLVEIQIINEITQRAQEVANVEQRLDAARRENEKMEAELAVHNELVDHLSRVVVLVKEQQTLFAPLAGKHEDTIAKQVEAMTRWVYNMQPLEKRDVQSFLGPIGSSDPAHSEMLPRLHSEAALVA